MMRRHTGGAGTSEVPVGVAVTALGERHQQERDEEQSARDADDALAKTGHRLEFG
jgi:hypothetical protein